MGACMSNNQIQWERAAHGAAVRTHLLQRGLVGTGDLSESTLRAKNSCQSFKRKHTHSAPELSQQ